MKRMPLLRRLRRWPALLLMVLMTGCATLTTPQPSEQIIPLAPAEATMPASRAAARFFLVDRLTRSTHLEGIDLHVRYLERTSAGLIAHLSFYNNSGVELAAISGVDPGMARLVGDDSYPVADRSESLMAGIHPPHSWLPGGATVGWLLFAGAQGDSFQLQFPGFPPTPIDLDQPVAAAPDVTPPAAGTWTYDLALTSPLLEGIELRVQRIDLDADELRLTIAFVNRTRADISFAASVTGGDAVLLDGNWQQYRPVQVAPTLADGIAPAGGVWGDGEINAGTLTFARPAVGDAVLFQFPTYPLARLPLRTDALAAVALSSDLPPSVAPRPVPTPVPTPTPLTGEALARREATEVLREMTDALARRDRDAFLAVFVPGLRAEYAAIFDRIATLPLSDVAFAAADNEAVNGELSADAAQLRDLRVELRYRVRDADPANIFASDLRFTLQRDAGRWQIAAVDGQAPYWAERETLAKRSGAFWIFYRPEMADEIEAIEAEAQAAFDQVTRRLPDRAEPVNVMFVSLTTDGFYEQTFRDAHEFLGVAVARYRIRKTSVTITNRAFYLNSAAFRNDPSQNRQRTIAHELVHLVLSPKTMPFTPAWVSEGAAMYYTDDFPLPVLADWLAREGPESVSLDELSALNSFGARDETEAHTALHYAYAAYLVRYLIDTYGEEAFLRFYDSFAAVPIDEVNAQLPRNVGGVIDNETLGRVAQQVTPKLVREAFGIDLATLEARYETWLAALLDDQP